MAPPPPPSPTTTKIIASLVIIMAALVTVSQACRPAHSEMPLMEDKTKASDILALGTFGNRVKDPRHPNKDIYIVDFNVQCIFKGGPLPATIKIHNVGRKDRMCKKVRMESEGTVIVYLNKEGNGYVPTYMEDPGAEEYVEEVTIVCGITVTYPIGYTADSISWKCPAAWDDEDCVALPPDPTFEPGMMATSTQASSDSENEAQVSDGSDDGNEAPYQPVKSGDGKQENNKEVKIGKETSKDGKGGKKSENLEATTQGGKADCIASSWIMSLGSLVIGLFVYYVPRV